MDETYKYNSKLGERLGNFKRSEIVGLSIQGKNYPIATKITIGRDKVNNIIIDDTLASRFHALIQKIKDAYFIKDLNSTNGTMVNGEEVPKDKYIKLYKNDVVKIGRTELIIQ
jgi:pSer/pThr/pTyr-binding forkhead associated (FHA) protein